MGQKFCKSCFELIESFLSAKISVQKFERSYLRLFKNAPSLSMTDYEILNALFLDVDAYCENPHLRDETDLNEVQLRNSAKKASEALRKLLPQNG